MHACYVYSYDVIKEIDIGKILRKQKDDAKLQSAYVPDTPKLLLSMYISVH